MLNHLLKLIWKRKTRHLMLSLEISLAFVVVFALAALAVRQFELFRMPLGLEHVDRWSVIMAGRQELTERPELMQEFQRSLAELPEVEQVALVTYSPFISANNRNNYGRLDGTGNVPSNVVSVSDEYPHTLGMQLVQGRWFGEADGGTDVIPVIITQSLAKELFQGQAAINQVFTYAMGKELSKARFRVTGVVTDYRDNGEFMQPQHFTLMRFSPKSGSAPPTHLVMKLKAGTPRIFEAKVLAQLQKIRADWSYQIGPLSDLRAEKLRMVLVPLTVTGVIAGFLLIMVAFGLFGVLWQSTTQRIPEIGLRRALGASATQVYGQIVVEQLLISSLSIGAAWVLLVQLPLTGVFGDELSWSVFGVATGIAMLSIYAISLLCALYPGWRASRLSPTQALHYE